MNPTRIARNVSTAAVATIAAWSSWSHMVHVALTFGERPEVAYVLPISVDGMLIVASAAMVEDKRARRTIRWSTRIAFVIGVAASVAANIAAAHPSLGARVVAAWPAVALLLVVEMLARSRGESAQPDATQDTYRPRTVKAETADTGRSQQPQGNNVRHIDDPKAIENPDGCDRPPVGADARRPNGRPSGHVRRSAAATAAAVAAIREQRPDATPADIAEAIGVSERHVRRLTTSPNRIHNFRAR